MSYKYSWLYCGTSPLHFLSHLLHHLALIIMRSTKTVHCLYAGPDVLGISFLASGICHGIAFEPQGTADHRASTSNQGPRCHRVACSLQATEEAHQSRSESTLSCASTQNVPHNDSRFSCSSNLLKACTRSFRPLLRSSRGIFSE
jgi:hypothetical protein